MWVSELDVTGMLSMAEPSPQFTIRLVSGLELEMLNVIVTVVFVLVGLGVGGLTVTVGAWGVWTVSEPVPWLVEPLLSVAVIVIVNTPLAEYVCVSEFAVPGRLSIAEPSPQFTAIDDTVPSGSVAENDAVTRDPVLAGFGVMLLKVTVGGLSFTVSVVVPEPDPALFVAVTVIVNVWDRPAPVVA
jgi:hypothetical protein